jgi:hypothetical protein
MRALSLLIDSPHLGELLRDRERDLAGAASEIEQAPTAAGLNRAEELVQHLPRVGNPEAVVIVSSRSIQIRIELTRAGHARILPRVRKDQGESLTGLRVRCFASIDLDDTDPWRTCRLCSTSSFALRPRRGTRSTFGSARSTDFH